MILSRLRTSRQGQNTLEYVVLLVLVMASIIMMGPYVIRSWNANLKGYEDSVTDSFNEPLLEADAGGISLPDECDACTPYISACGDGIVCPKTNIYETRSCPSLACGITNCGGVDPSCCAGEASTEAPGCCGPNADSCGCPGGCPDGQACWSQDCGGGTQYFCAVHDGCKFACQGDHPSDLYEVEPYRFGGICPGDHAGLAAPDIDWHPVATCSNDPADKCEYRCGSGPGIGINADGICECLPPFIRNPSGSGCMCDLSEAEVMLPVVGKYHDDNVVEVENTQNCPSGSMVTRAYCYYEGQVEEKEIPHPSILDKMMTENSPIETVGYATGWRCTSRDTDLTTTGNGIQFYIEIGCTPNSCMSPGDGSPGLPGSGL